MLILPMILSVEGFQHEFYALERAIVVRKTNLKAKLIHIKDNKKMGCSSNSFNVNCNSSTTTISAPFISAPFINEPFRGFAFNVIAIYHDACLIKVDKVIIVDNDNPAAMGALINFKQI